MKKLFKISLLGLIFESVFSYIKSDHFDGKHFFNLDHKAGHKSLIDILKWRFTGKKEKWPTKVINTEKPQLPKMIQSNEVYVTFINHSSELIQVNGLNIITDPIFSERASPLSWYGPKRVRAPGISFEDLPPIDIVVVSHNHYDHMDLPSLKNLAEKHNPLFIVPLNNAYILKKKGISKIVELDWWQKYELSESKTITAIPAQHWSRRSLWDANKSLWGGFVLNANNMQILFAGDTGYGEHIKLIFERFGKMDVCILPIGSYEPQWFMKYNHLNPEEAVKAHLLLGSDLSIGIHYGTFQLSNEGYNDPTNNLKIALAKYHVDEKAFLAPTNGKTMYFKKVKTVNDQPLK